MSFIFSKLATLFPYSSYGDEYIVNANIVVILPYFLSPNILSNKNESPSVTTNKKKNNNNVIVDEVFPIKLKDTKATVIDSIVSTTQTRLSPTDTLSKCFAELELNNFHLCVSGKVNWEKKNQTFCEVLTIVQHHPSQFNTAPLTIVCIPVLQLAHETVPYPMNNSNSNTAQNTSTPNLELGPKALQWLSCVEGTIQLYPISICGSSRSGKSTIANALASCLLTNTLLNIDYNHPNNNHGEGSGAKTNSYFGGIISQDIPCHIVRPFLTSGLTRSCTSGVWFIIIPLDINSSWIIYDCEGFNNETNSIHRQLSSFISCISNEILFVDYSQLNHRSLQSLGQFAALRTQMILQPQPSETFKFTPPRSKLLVILNKSTVQIDMGTFENDHENNPKLESNSDHISRKEQCFWLEFLSPQSHDKYDPEREQIQKTFPHATLAIIPIEDHFSPIHYSKGFNDKLRSIAYFLTQSTKDQPFTCIWQNNPIALFSHQYVDLLQRVLTNT